MLLESNKNPLTLALAVNRAEISPSAESPISPDRCVIRPLKIPNQKTTATKTFHEGSSGVFTLFLHISHLPNTHHPFCFFFFFIISLFPIPVQNALKLSFAKNLLYYSCSWLINNENAALMLNPNAKKEKVKKTATTQHSKVHRCPTKPAPTSRRATKLAPISFSPFCQSLRETDKKKTALRGTALRSSFHSFYHSPKSVRSSHTARGTELFNPWGQPERKHRKCLLFRAV